MRKARKQIALNLNSDIFHLPNHRDVSANMESFAVKSKVAFLSRSPSGLYVCQHRYQQIKLKTSFS